MKAKLQAWAWCMVLIAAMAIACEPMRLICDDADASSEYVLIDRYGELEFSVDATRRICPPAQIHWAPNAADPETVGGDCYTTGALVEVNHEYIALVQSQWPASGYLECDIQIPWEQVISAFNYETQAMILRPSPK